MNLRDFFRPFPELKTVIVNLKTGTAFRGVVWQRRGLFLVLKNAEMLQNGKPTALDGEVIVQMTDIEFMQVT